VVTRSSPLIAAALLVLALAPAAARSPGGPVTSGYPYARDCPAGGDRDDVDRWNMYACNCTSYVAWALQRNGYRVDWFVAGSMDARNWPNVARWKRITTGGRPRLGAVAVWPNVTRFGHVAFVTAVHADGTFDVAEYNLPPSLGGVRFGFDRRSDVSPRGVTFVYVPKRR
jgi:peptidoglycan DL-endopeptidase CwlO